MRDPELQLEAVAAVQTDVGRERDNNEDSFRLIDLEAGKAVEGPVEVRLSPEEAGLLVLVADGMGGHEAGEVASSLAVATVEEQVLSELSARPAATQQALAACLGSAIATANRVIAEEGARSGGARPMGTTLTAALVQASGACFAQVGDSRAYLLRGNTLARMTSDQTLAAHLERRARESGEPMPAGEDVSNVLLQALGSQPKVRIDFTRCEVRPGDWIVLCSDGLYGEIGDDRIGDLVRAAPDPASACRALVDAALQAGGQDNVTVVVIRLAGTGAPGSAGEVLRPCVERFRPEGAGRFELWNDTMVAGAAPGDEALSSARGYYTIALVLAGALIALAGALWVAGIIPGRQAQPPPVELLPAMAPQAPEGQIPHEAARAETPLEAGPEPRFFELRAALPGPCVHPDLPGPSNERLLEGIFGCQNALPIPGAAEH